MYQRKEIIVKIDLLHHVAASMGASICQVKENKSMSKASNLLEHIRQIVAPLNEFSCIAFSYS